MNAIWRSFMSPDGLKFAFTVGAAVAAFIWCRRVSPSKLSSRGQTPIRALLLALATYALWLEPVFIGGHRFIHVWDVYHYDLGARYLPEMGYGGLYACTTEADADNGHADELPGLMIRDLRDNRVGPAGPQVEREKCKERFAPERWAAFRRDVAFYRDRLSAEAYRNPNSDGRQARRWELLRRDHGFNGSPLWIALGLPLATLASTSDGPNLNGLAAPDVVIVLGVLTAFAFFLPLRVALAALGYFALDVLSRYGWTSGCFLRYDWLAIVIAGMLLLRAQRPLAAGAALGVAMVSRIFPMVVVAGTLAASGAAWLLAPEDSPIRQREWIFVRRFGVGIVLAAAIAIPLGTAASGRGFAVWSEFAQNTKKHAGTAGNNYILGTLFGYESATDRAKHYEELLAADPALAPEGEQGLYSAAVHELQSDRWWMRILFSLLALGLFVAAAYREEPWVRGALALLLLPALVDLSCYYYVAWMGVGLLAQRWRWILPALLALAAASRGIEIVSSSGDAEYAGISAVAAVFAIAVLSAIVLFGRQSRDGRPPADMAAPRASS